MNQLIKNEPWKPDTTVLAYWKAERIHYMRIFKGQYPVKGITPSKSARIANRFIAKMIKVK